MKIYRKLSLFTTLIVGSTFLGGIAVAQVEVESVIPGHDFAESILTPAEMGGAKPLPFYTPPAGAAAAADAAFAASGIAAGSSAGAPQSRPPEAPDTISGAAGSRNQYAGYPAMYSGYSRFLTPWKRVGKLFFKKSNGSSYTCSASVIGRKNAVVTAAHCCYDRGGQRWNNSFVFVPGYQWGTAFPYGSFGWTGARILTAWKTIGARRYDVCVIKFNKLGSKRKYLSSSVGWLGRSWNYGSYQLFNTLGYPGNKGSGRSQQVCASEGYKSCGSNWVTATGCDKTYGDSGGPWIRKFEPRAGGNYVNSVTSGWDSCLGSGTFGHTYNGARFTSYNIVPLCSNYCD